MVGPSLLLHIRAFLCKYLGVPCNPKATSWILQNKCSITIKEIIETSLHSGAGQKCQAALLYSFTDKPNFFLLQLQAYCACTGCLILYARCDHYNSASCTLHHSYWGSVMQETKYRKTAQEKINTIAGNT